MCVRLVRGCVLAKLKQIHIQAPSILLFIIGTVYQFNE